MAKQANDSTYTVKGIIYQFLVALEKCFELSEGEAVYIETFGDISILGEGSKQIEAKFYKGYLNELDHNVWNTLNNWTKEDFPLDQFKSLVLLTTQKVKSDSPWHGWNEKNLLQKRLVVNAIKERFSRKKSPGKETASLFNSIFDSENSKRLDNVLEKFVIDHNSKGDMELYNSLLNTRTQHIPKTRKDEFLKYLFGFITNPKAINNNNWSVDYTDFSREVENISSRLVETTTSFPPRIEVDNISEDDFVGSLFIEKIKDINYDEEIPNAIAEYVQTREMIIREFRVSPTLHKALDEYEKGVIRTFKYKHRLASRKLSNNIHSESQSFFDEMMTHNYGTFHTYSTVPPYFDGGLLHNLADEEDLDIKWLLTQKQTPNE